MEVDGEIGTVCKPSSQARRLGHAAHGTRRSPGALASSRGGQANLTARHPMYFCVRQSERCARLARCAPTRIARGIRRANKTASLSERRMYPVAPSSRARGVRSCPSA